MHAALASYLMVEKPGVLLYERDTQLLRRLEHGGIVLAASRGGDVLGS